MLKRLGYLLLCFVLSFVVVYKSGQVMAWRTVYRLGDFEPNFGQDSHYGILQFTWVLLGGMAALLATVTHLIEVLFSNPLNWYWRAATVLGSGAIAFVYGQRLIIPVLIPSLSATAIAPPAIFLSVLLIGIELVMWLAIILAANAGSLVAGRILTIIVRMLRNTG